MYRENIHKSIIVSVLLLIVIGFIGCSCIPHWSNVPITDKTIVYLNSQIENIGDGLADAKKIVDRWHEGAFLSKVKIYFKDTSSFMTNIGDLTYRYTAINDSKIGNPYAECSVEIDLEKVAIVEFRAFSTQLEPIYEPLDISKWNMDYTEISKLINEYVDIDILYNSPTKRSNIFMGQDTWNIMIYPNIDSNIIETDIWIDPIKVEIMRIEYGDEDGNPKEIDLHKAND